MTEMEKVILGNMIVYELLKNEKKILAVKIIRFMYDTGLPEAKEYIDYIQKIKENK
jgi:ribosomal protein L7/L12